MCEVDNEQIVAADSVVCGYIVRCRSSACPDRVQRFPRESDRGSGCSGLSGCAVFDRAGTVEGSPRLNRKVARTAACGDHRWSQTRTPYPLRKHEHQLRRETGLPSSRSVLRQSKECCTHGYGSRLTLDLCSFRDRLGFKSLTSLTGPGPPAFMGHFNAPSSL